MRVRLFARIGRISCRFPPGADIPFPLPSSSSVKPALCRLRWHHLDYGGIVTEDRGDQYWIFDTPVFISGRIGCRGGSKACPVPESMDPNKEGVLNVYSGGRFGIPSPGAPIPKPKIAPPGIMQATQMVEDSPLVLGGATVAAFIKLFDADGDGKVGHMEWEKLNNDTVFKPHRWPRYNKNCDEWIALDEARKADAGE